MEDLMDQPRSLSLNDLVINYRNNHWRYIWPISQGLKWATFSEMCIIPDLS